MDSSRFVLEAVVYPTVNRLNSIAEDTPMSNIEPDSGQEVPRAVIQVYRAEGGKLAETWVAPHGPGSTWPEDEEG